ncbi:type II restriction endonuclease [Helicobacter pylori]|nr:type II restriction endonuclease [Helicobacter pylori]
MLLDFRVFKKQLVPMNPDNQVNYKLTLNLKELKEIANLTKELKEIANLTKELKGILESD